jgi:hypothetical protein
MQELRLVAVSEDGSYAILAVPGRSGRFLLPIDERLRTVAKGQFSRLAQYEIEVENPLRPKEIQDRIRAGETADEIADAAGIPPDRVRRFEGPVLAERQYRAQEAQRATIRGHSDSGPGPRLGDIVAERLTLAGGSAENAEWDSRKRPDGNWQVQLQFSIAGRPGLAEWIYDPRRRHVIPDDDQAVRLSLPQAEWSAAQFAERSRASATVTPIGSRQFGQHPEQGRELDRHPSQGAARFSGSGPAAGHEGLIHEGFMSAASASQVGAGTREPAAALADPREPAAALADPGEPAAALADPGEAASEAAAETRPARKAAGSRSRRASVPSWDEIMFGTSRQSD